MNQGLRLYEDLLANRCNPDQDAYWPEANSILGHVSTTPQLDAFYSHATVLARYRFFDYWEPDTNDFFAAMLAIKKEAKTVDKVDRLLRLWTKAGTLLPKEQHHRDAIGEFLAHCDAASGCRLLMVAPGASKTLPPKTLTNWLQTAVSYASTRPDPSPLSFFAYHLGALDGLNDAQKEVALRHYVDASTLWTPPFSAGIKLATGHPEPARLQLAFLHRMLHAAFRQGPGSTLRAEMQTDFLEAIREWPACAESPSVLHQAQVFVLGALFERCIPGTLATLPGPWTLVQETLPLLESLHMVAWEPLQSEGVVRTLATALAPMLNPLSAQLESVPLPQDWSPSF